MSICDICHARTERPAPHAARTREYYDILIKPLRYVAYRCGYALAVHGSLGFDIDLVACPWRDTAISAQHLAEEIRSTAEKIIGICKIWKKDEGRLPEKKPCGRLGWSFYLVQEDCGQLGPYIDLSVMPIVKEEAL